MQLAVAQNLILGEYNFGHEKKDLELFSTPSLGLRMDHKLGKQMVATAVFIFLLVITMD